MKSPRLIEIDGMKFPPTFDAEIYRTASKFKPGKDTLVVATFPKCGTTWVLQIAGLILRKGVPPADVDEYFSLFPFMEMTPLQQLENHRKDGCIKTHLPFDRITFSEDAKYIYVARHPADCAVSYYHHVRYFPIYFYSDATFDDFFEVFVSGKTDFGDYFDNLLSWYEHRNKPNVFFITYETLKEDPRGTILKMAKFIGEEYYESLKEDDEKILKKVLEYSSIDYMKKTVDEYWRDFFIKHVPEELRKVSPVMKNYAMLLEEALKKGHHSVGSFIRKGGVGEGKITLSEDQRRRLELRIKEKCAHSDVMDLWKSQS